MKADWRFHASPQAKNGLRSYAGTQIRLPLQNGEEVSLGTLCVASVTTQPALDEEQKASLVRVADVIMGEIMSRKQLQRMQERQAMSERLDQFRVKAHAEYLEAEIIRELSSRYPACLPFIAKIEANNVELPSGGLLPLTSVQDGMWEDTEFIRGCIQSGQFQEAVKQRKVRAAIAPIAPKGRVLVLATSTLGCVFDDLDVWYVDQCAQTINTSAQARSLREALDAKNTFLRSVTHELRTPIHAILSSVELATELIRSLDNPNGSGGPPLDSASIGPFLDTIRRSSTELMTTVNNILRLNAFVTDMKSFPTDYDLQSIETDVLDEIFASCIDDQSPALSVRFDNQIPASLCSVKMDGNLLRELLKCLILNSIAATPDGSILVTISLNEEESILLFDLKDTGTGIAEADHSRIFQAFEKVNSHSPGAGLGLSLACQMTRTLGGRLSLVSSALNEGSHFRVAVPHIPAKTSKRSTRRWSSVNRYLASHYSIHLRSKRSMHLIEHLEQHLQSRDFRKSDLDQASFIIMNQSDTLPDDISFLRNLDKPHAILYVCETSPTKEALDSIVKEHKPHMVYPVVGPLYSSRIDEMMLEADIAFAAYIKPANPSQARLTSSTADGPIHITPYAMLATPPITPGTESLRPILTNSPAPSVKALLVDDNKVNLSVLQMYCKRRKMSHGVAYDGNEAVSEFRRTASSSSDNSYNVVFMDLQMPECDGVEACRQIRRYERDHSLPRSTIFILTGQDSVSDRKEAFEAGVDDYFVKPVSVRKLDQAIARYSPGSPR